MSFSSLPTELVRQIIESTVPSTFHSTTYRERQSTLRSVCLVNRHFRQIAQSLLYEIVWINKAKPTIIKSIESQTEPTKLRELAVSPGTRRPYEPLFLNRFARNFETLNTLIIDMTWSKMTSMGRFVKFDLAILQSIPHLKTLHLVGQHFEVPQHFRLASLVHLSFDSGDPLCVASKLLSKLVLPALRSLAIVDLSDEEVKDEIARSPFKSLLPQLDALSLGCEGIENALELFPSDFLDRTLFDLLENDTQAQDIWATAVRHLRIVQSDNNGPHQRRSNPDLEILSRLASTIQSQDIPLRSLYLSSYLRHPSSSLPKGLYEAVQKVQQACEEKDVEMIWEQQQEYDRIDVRYFDEFCRRQREKRAKGHR